MNVIESIKDQVASFSGKAGVAVKSLTAQAAFELNADEIFPTASMIKIPILVELFRQRDEGLFSLEARLTLKDSDKVGGSGILNNLGAGLQLNIEDLAVLMIALSDNTATNMIIDLLGIESINRTIKKSGMTQTELRNKINFELIAKSNDNLAVGAARDFVTLLEHLSNHTILTLESCEAIIRIMRNQKYMERIRRYLPYNPYAETYKEEQEFWIASKTGGLKGVRCESALIKTPKSKYAISIMTKDCQDAKYTSDNEGVVFIARVSKMVYDYFQT